MSEFVVAEMQTIELNAALYDARFARTLMFALGIFITAASIYMIVTPGVFLGVFTLFGGFYFTAVKIPKLEEELRITRVNLAVAIERLGQYRPYGCE